MTRYLPCRDAVKRGAGRIRFINWLRLMIFFFFLPVIYIRAQDNPVIDPMHYNEIAESSVDLLRVIDSYNAAMQEDDPLLFMGIDVFFIPRLFTFPSTYGSLAGTPMQFDASVNFRFLSLDNLTARFFLFGSYFYFMLNNDTVETIGFLREHEIRDGWQYGNAVTGLHLEADDYYFTLGANLKYRPCIAENDDGSALFDTYYNEETREYDTKIFTYNQIYFDARISGYKLNTLFTFSSLEQLALEKLFALVTDVFHLGPSLYFFSRLSSFQPGFCFDYTLWEALTLYGGIYFYIKTDQWNSGFSRAYLNLDAPLFTITDKDDPKHSLKAILKAKTSLALEYGNRWLPGFSADLTIKNLRLWSVWNLLGVKTFAHLSAGVSYNYYEALQRLPFADSFLFWIKLQPFLD